MAGTTGFTFEPEYSEEELEARGKAARALLTNDSHTVMRVVE